MKNIIFFDGIDGSGKSTLIEAVRAELTIKYDLDCTVLDGNNPVEYKRLYKVTQHKQLGASNISVFSFRMCRMNLLLNRAINRPNTITMFDRGILHLLVQCKIDNIDSNVLNYFLDDAFHNLSTLKHGHVFINPPFDVVRERISNREDADELDLDTEYQSNYHKLLNELFDSTKLANKISIDTNKYEIENCVKSMVKFIME